MESLALLLGMLALSGCSQDSGSPANPVQPPGSGVSDTAQVAVFADTSLEASVRAALGIPTGPLPQAALDTLTQLVARGRGIANLAGIDSLKDLQVLDLADNQIRDISPLVALVQLTWLDLENNNIQDISPLAALAQLQNLALGFNAVSDIAPLTALSELHSVGLEGNPLDEASLTHHLATLRIRGVAVAVAVAQGAPPIEESALALDLPGRIAFSAKPALNEGSFDLYVFSPRSGQLVQLTDDQADDFAPDWSPDGAKVAFVRGEVRGDIYVAETGGAGAARLRNLTGGKGDNRNPAWSPDGQHIAFEHSTSATYKEIFLMNADGEAWVRLTASDWDDEYPCWSPDGQHIAFTSLKEGRGYPQLFVMAADGSDVTYLASPLGAAWLSRVHPGWSPDGARIVLGVWASAVFGTVVELISIRADGTDLVNHGRGGDTPCWLDGGKVLYVVPQRTRGLGIDRADIHVRDLVSGDAGNLSELLRNNRLLNTLINTDPSWTPADW